MNRPDLNCDLGEHESSTTTEELMRWIDSANIACGGHAGDHDSMKRCIDLAQQHNVRIGAHPGLAENGGRGKRFPTAQELIQLLDDQVLPFQELVTAQGATLHHIKLHGTLYHATDQDSELASVYLHWCEKNSPHSLLYLRSNGPTAYQAEILNTPFWHECFLDRAYESDGSLRARHHPDALLPDLCALQQRLELWRDQQALLAHDGALIFLPCQTFCLHSDSALALPFASLAKKFFTVEPSDS